MELTNSFESLLLTFSPVFTEPSFKTFRLLMTGWILSTRHRYVTDLIVSSDSVNNGHFSDYHRFFSKSVWDIDHLWKLLTLLIVSTLSGHGILRTLPDNIDLIGPVHPEAALYAPAAKETKIRRGPLRKKGDRLPSIEAWEKDHSSWKVLHYDQYGLHGSLRVKTRTGQSTNADFL